jgi:NitT/TauT family transport system ATP-binding protein
MEATTIPALAVENVSKQFETADGPVLAIENFSFEVQAGEFVSIIGPSGCGKTTLFNIIGGLIEEYDGGVRVDGEVVRGSHRSIGMVFQEESTFPWRTTLENVAFPLEAAGMSKRERLARAGELVRLVGLEGFENRYPAQLSGGMRQRTAMARTLAFSPRILLMDEPFAALDEQTRLLLGDKVLQIQQKLRQTTLLITHNIAEAVQLSDRVLIMSYRPGRLKRAVEIELPRPRSSEILGSAVFGQYVASLWSDLREEASKGLIADEAALGAL